MQHSNTLGLMFGVSSGGGSQLAHADGSVEEQGKLYFAYIEACLWCEAGREKKCASRLLRASQGLPALDELAVGMEFTHRSIEPSSPRGVTVVRGSLRDSADKK